MMLVDDVVFCSREKDVLDVELEQWRAALEKSGTKVSRAKREYTCLNGMPAGSVNMQFPAATGHRIQISGKHPAEQWIHEVNKRTR